MLICGCRHINLLHELRVRLCCDDCVSMVTTSSSASWSGYSRLLQVTLSGLRDRYHPPQPQQPQQPQQAFIAALLILLKVH